MAKRPHMILDDDSAGSAGSALKKRRSASAAAGFATPPLYTAAEQQSESPWAMEHYGLMQPETAEGFSPDDWDVVNHYVDSDGVTWELWAHRVDGWSWWWSPTGNCWYADRR